MTAGKITAGELLREMTGLLKAADNESPAMEAGVLLGHVTGLDRGMLLARPETPVSPEDEDRVRGLMNRRLNHEPLQYLLGTQEFMGLSFVVTPDVLIPRHDTEHLVETGAAFLKNRPGSRFLDMCTGSGCIALATLHHAPETQAVGAELSEAALHVAAENAALLRLSDRISFRQGDLWSAISAEDAPFDAILSNPPYIPVGDKPELAPEVRDHEPEMALYGQDTDGLGFYRRITAGAGVFLKPGGLLAVEVGINQAEKVRSMFIASGFTEPAGGWFVCDYAGIERVVRGLWHQA